MQRALFQVWVGVFNCQQILTKISFVIFDIVANKQIECCLVWPRWNVTDLGLIDMFFLPIRMQKLLLVYLLFRNRATSRIWNVLTNMVFPPIWGEKYGGVLSMRKQVILDSLLPRPGSAPIRNGKKGEFWYWTTGNHIFKNLSQKFGVFQSLNFCLRTMLELYRFFKCKNSHFFVYLNFTDF